MPHNKSIVSGATVRIPQAQDDMNISQRVSRELVKIRTMKVLRKKFMFMILPPSLDLSSV